MEIGEPRVLESYFRRGVLDRVVEGLHQAAARTEPKTPGLSRLTIGLAYGDLVREHLRGIADSCGFRVFRGNPSIYGIDDLRLIHYSVHPKMDTFVTNQNKHLVDEYLRRKTQRVLPNTQMGIPERLRGELAILATELEVGASSGGIRSVSLKHAFIGLPARVSDDTREIVAWEDPVCDLIARTANVAVGIEEHKKIEEIKPRRSDDAAKNE